MSENTKPERPDRDVILNLDELLGLSPTLKVRWQGRDYEHRHLRALSPEALAQFLRLQERLKDEKGADDADSFLRMAEAQDEMLKIIAPDMLDLDLSFMQKVQILSFYMDRVNQDYGLGELVSPQTGGEPSPP